MLKVVGYNGNPNLFSAGTIHNYTAEEIEEFAKCAADPIYFARNYIKIIHVDKGIIPFDMWDFQEKMIRTFTDERYVICKLPRQVGKSTTTIAFLLHYILFNEYVNVAILANKATTARSLLQKLQLAFENLPTFLKQGIVSWNKGSVELANGSRIVAEATTSASVRGQSFNIIFLDEFAFVPNNLAEEFFRSTYPTVSSGKTTKVIIVSTPNGMNHFYKMWYEATEAEEKSGYVPISIEWNDVPGRDDAWRADQIRKTSLEQFLQEFCTEFIGSSHTLISSTKLRSLVMKKPIEIRDGLDIHIHPQPGRTYVITCDVSRGQGLDYSAFSVFDVTELPYRQVAKYRNNLVPLVLYPTHIYMAARYYNDAFVLVEINDTGQQVAEALHYDLMYENLYKIHTKGKMGQQVSAGHNKKIQFGVKTSTQVKRIGCSNLKSLVENDKLLVNDADTVMELMKFVADRQSFAAEPGEHDDLSMTLVLFSWLAAQRLFRESTATDIRQKIQEEQMNIMDSDIVPFGVISNGIDEEPEIDAQGDRWIAERRKIDPFGNLQMDWNWFNKV